MSSKTTLVPSVLTTSEVDGTVLQALEAFQRTELQLRLTMVQNGHELNDSVPGAPEGQEPISYAQRFEVLQQGQRRICDFWPESIGRITATGE